MAKVWFSKTSNGGCYELTHWGESPITSDEEMRNIINKSYNRSLAEKILELLNIASMGFVTSGVRNLTQFKEWWAYCFRPLLAA